MTHSVGFYAIVNAMLFKKTKNRVISCAISIGMVCLFLCNSIAHDSPLAPRNISTTTAAYKLGIAVGDILGLKDWDRERIEMATRSLLKALTSGESGLNGIDLRAQLEKSQDLVQELNFGPLIPCAYGTSRIGDNWYMRWWVADKFSQEPRSYIAEFPVSGELRVRVYPEAKQREPFRGEQTTNTVFMVSPDEFAYNAQTAETNVFQGKPGDPPTQRKLAVEQFDVFVAKLRMEGVNVILANSPKECPDAVFPNNWLSIHRTEDGRNLLVIYPMHTPNRRAERQVEVLKEKLEERGIHISRVIDLTGHEETDKALEGTGSLVLDRVNKVAFASISPRTNEKVLEDFCARLGYRYVAFHSYNAETLIYHTNLMMSIGENFAIVCADAIEDPAEKADVLAELEALGKEIIEVSLDQMGNMCCNILQLNTKNGTKIIVMSQRSYENFTPDQKEKLKKHGKLTPMDIHTIEDVGGGSARCMLAEVFFDSDKETEFNGPNDGIMQADDIIKEMLPVAEEAHAGFIKKLSKGKTRVITDEGIFEAGAYEKDIKGHLLNGRYVASGDICSLEKCNTKDADDILRAIKRGDYSPERTIVQVSSELSPVDIKRLEDEAPKGVRFMRVDTNALDVRYNKDLDPDTRWRLRFSLYGLLLAARDITEDDVRNKEASSAYRILRFFLEAHGIKDADSYMEELVRDNVAFLVNHCLSFVPIDPWSKVIRYYLIGITCIAGAA